MKDLVAQKSDATRNGKARHLGAAVLDPKDAYKDVPILQQPTWNHEVAAYFFFGGISAGAAMIGSLADVFGGERRERLARTAHYVSFATLVPCPPLLIDDLGMPQRFHHMLRIFKPSSPMNFGAWALTTHGAGATFTVGRMLAAEGKLPVIGFLFRLFPERLLAAAGLPSSLALAGYTGVLLGTTSVPVWYTSPLLGALFMASSFNTGAAATNLVATFTGRQDESEHAALASVSLASSAVELSVLGGYLATVGPNAGKHLFIGKQAALMAGTIATLLTATALEVASMATGHRHRTLTRAAAVATLAGGAMLRWAMVRAGRASASDREATLEAMKPRKDNPGWGPGRRGNGA